MMNEKVKSAVREISNDLDRLSQLVSDWYDILDAASPSLMDSDSSAVDCWRAATTLAEKCGVLDPDTARFLSQMSGDWRVELPSDLRAMPALYSRETWRVLEEEYNISPETKNATAKLLMRVKRYNLAYGLIIF